MKKYTVEFVAYIVLFIIIAIGLKSCHSSNWNNGICPECNVRYELRGASNTTKYYACPECGQEAYRN